MRAGSRALLATTVSISAEHQISDWLNGSATFLPGFAHRLVDNARIVTMGS